MPETENTAGELFRAGKLTAAMFEEVFHAVMHHLDPGTRTHHAV